MKICRQLTIYARRYVNFVILYKTYFSSSFHTGALYMTESEVFCTVTLSWCAGGGQATFGVHNDSPPPTMLAYVIMVKLYSKLN